MQTACVVAVVVGVVVVVDVVVVVAVVVEVVRSDCAHLAEKPVPQVAEAEVDVLLRTTVNAPRRDLIADVGLTLLVNVASLFPPVLVPS